MTGSILISVLALALSLFSSILSLRADRRAREGVRPYVSTGVHLVPDDMGVSLSNYGAGVAIITKISMRRGEGPPKKSLSSLLPSSPNYELRRVIDFVQDQYFLRPGDELLIATAKGTTNDALQDWIDALDGIKIEVDYLDVFGKAFHYARLISTKTHS
jgi:hypothetical protein